MQKSGRLIDSAESGCRFGEVSEETVKSIVNREEFPCSVIDLRTLSGNTECISKNRSLELANKLILTDLNLSTSTERLGVSKLDPLDVLRTKGVPSLPETKREGVESANTDGQIKTQGSVKKGPQKVPTQVTEQRVETETTPRVPKKAKELLPHAGSVRRYGGHKALERFLQSSDNDTFIVLKFEERFIFVSWWKYFVRDLGKGGFGDVKLCRDSATGEEFVVKEVLKEGFNMNEAILPVRLKHRNFVELFGAALTRESEKMKVILFLEHAGEQMGQYIANSKNFPLTEDVFYDLCYQGFSALDFLHRHGVMHFDIKPNNLCLKKDGAKLILKVIDFGSAKTSFQSLTSRLIAWTIEYLPAESCSFYLQWQGKLDSNITEKDITTAVDVFAMSLTLTYLKTRSHLLVSLVTGGAGYPCGITKETLHQYHLKILWKMALEGERCLEPLIEKIAFDDTMRKIMYGTICPADKRLTANAVLKKLEGRTMDSKSRKARKRLQGETGGYPEVDSPKKVSRQMPVMEKTSEEPTNQIQKRTQISDRSYENRQDAIVSVKENKESNTNVSMENSLVKQRLRQLLHKRSEKKRKLAPDRGTCGQAVEGRTATEDTLKEQTEDQHNS